MQGTVLFGVRRAYLAEILPGTVAPAQYGFSDDDPRVVVAFKYRFHSFPFPKPLALCAWRSGYAAGKEKNGSEKQ